MENKMNVLLDLDNTIINALDEQERSVLPIEFQNRFDYKDMPIYGLRVFGRPGLQTFLDYLFTHFNVSVFTAAEQEYALFIVNNFLLTKPGRKVHYIFFRYHVNMGLERYNGTKDLRLLWNVFKIPMFQPCNTVIIDDLIDVYETNPKHTIRIKSFDVSSNKQMVADSVDDTDLERVQVILEKLDQNFKASECPRKLYLGKEPKESSPFLI